MKKFGAQKQLSGVANTATTPKRMGRFFRSQLGLTFPLAPGDFIHLAREIDARMVDLRRSKAPEGSDERLRLAGEIFARRRELANSQPVTDLDALMVTLNARQGLEILSGLALDEEHAPHREYWFDEISAALCGVQALFETLVGMSAEDMGFSLKGGTEIH